MELNIGFQGDKHPFRTWLNNRYYENQQERDSFNDKKISLKEYFRDNKWWLKSEFKRQTKS